MVEVGEGPLTIVVLHGGPGLRHNYLRPEWDQLGEVGRLVYYDQRGCGLSSREGPFSWERHVQDLDELLGRLRPPGRVVLAGSSWGAFLALLYAHSHPDRVAGLVLSGLVAGAWDDAGERLARQAEARARARASARVFVRGAPPTVYDSVTVARSNPAPINQRLGEKCVANSQATMESFHGTAPLRESLGRVAAPTLIFEGTTPDERGDAGRQFAALLPNARLVSIAAGHDPWLEQPALFFAEAKRFLRALSPAP